MNKTHSVSKNDIQPKWHFIDARGKILGKVASEAAAILAGKKNVTYSPHLDMMDKVVITNASKIAVTGNKLTKKIYYRHTGFPGGIKQEILGDLLERRPTEVLRKAVKGMLPYNKLRKARIANLYIYPGAEHPHTANLSTKKES
ncbi:MAG: 50S ribosomal protein L13 [Patescibacteria group bacterium]